MEPLNRAIAGSHQQSHFYIREGDPLPIDDCFADPNGRGNLVVEDVSLDEYFLARSEKIDFVKVDAESAEDKVLDGAHGLIARDFPSILMEVLHFDGTLELRVTPAKLRELGYHVEQLDRGPLTSHFWAEWPELN